MSRQHRTSVFVLVCLVSALVGQPAEAQAEPGEGIQGENLKLRLGVDVGTLVNNNLFFQPTDTVPALQLNINPFLSINSLDARRVSLTFDWRAGYQQFLSTNDAVFAQSGLSTELGGALHLNQAGAVSLRLEEAFTRTNEAPNSVSTSSIHRIINRAGAILGVHPGGRVLQGYLGYHWTSFNYRFDDTSLSDANNDEHQFQLRGLWQFLPRTAANVTVDYRLINYDEPTRDIGAASIENVNSRPLRITAGVSGLLLTRLGVALDAGYARARYIDSASFNGMIFRGQVNYYLTNDQNSSVYTRYIRSFQDSTLGNFFTSHIGAIGYEQLLMDERLQVRVEGLAELREYQFPEEIQAVPLPNGGSVSIAQQINDTLLGAQLNANYKFRKWASLGAGYQLRANVADNDALTFERTPNTVEIARDYVQHVVTVNFRAVY